MKTINLVMVLFFCFSNLAFAEEPRTVSVYKRHMKSDDHNANDFEHNLHHMLYLSGVADAYSSLNNKSIAAGQHPLYCQPATTQISSADIMKILDKKLYHSEHPAEEDLSVAEALLQALKEEFPCN